MTDVDRGPARLSRRASATAGGVAFLASGAYSWPGMAVGAVGLALLWAGLFRGSTRATTTGAFGLVLAAIVAGSLGAPVLPVLSGVVFAVVAGDAAANAVCIGKQLGRSADTGRLETVRVASTLSVGVLSAGVGYGIYLLASGGQPVAAVVFLTLGAILLVTTLD